MRGRRHEPATARSTRLGAPGLSWRLAVGSTTIALAALGTLVGTDDWWPYAPMSQYAFGVPNDGVINSFYLDALRVDGTTSQVALSKEGIGLERAEMEGQLPRFQEDPSIMQAVAVLQHRRQPEASPLVEIYLRNRQTDLTGDRDQRIITLSTWTVRDPLDPERGLRTR